MQFSVCEEMYFESNNPITVGTIRVKFRAILLSFPLFLPFTPPFLPGLSSAWFFVTIMPAGIYVYNAAVTMSLVRRKIFFCTFAHRFSSAMCEEIGRDYRTRDLLKRHVMSGPRAAIKFRFTPELPKIRTWRVIEPRHVEIAPMI